MDQRRKKPGSPPKRRSTAQNRAAQIAAKKKRQKQQRLVRMYMVAGIVALLVIGGLYIQFSQNTPPVSPTLAHVAAEGTVQDAVETAIPKYTPVPTPTIVPTPTPAPTAEPMPTPVPDPTPYPYQDFGSKYKTDRKMIALTFDDGPHAKITPQILDVLKKNGIKATFFQLGENVVLNPSITQRILDEGHQLGTHTYSHKELTKLSEKEIEEEINRSIWAFQDAANFTPVLLRPPYGSINDLVRTTVKMPLINWSVDTLDWKSRNAKKIYNHMISDTKDGDIILCHDLYQSTLDGIKKAIPQLKKMGFQFVTIDELFEARGPELEFGKTYLSATPAAKKIGP